MDIILLSRLVAFACDSSDPIRAHDMRARVEQRRTACGALASNAETKAADCHGGDCRAPDSDQYACPLNGGLRA